MSFLYASLKAVLFKEQSSMEVGFPLESKVEKFVSAPLRFPQIPSIRRWFSVFITKLGGDLVNGTSTIKATITKKDETHKHKVNGLCDKDIFSRLDGKLYTCAKLQERHLCVNDRENRVQGHY